MDYHGIFCRSLPVILRVQVFTEIKQIIIDKQNRCKVCYTKHHGCLWMQTHRFVKFCADDTSVSICCARWDGDVFSASVPPTFCSAYVLCMSCCLELNLLLKIFSGSCKLFSHLIRFIKNLLSKWTVMFPAGIVFNVSIIQNAQWTCIMTAEYSVESLQHLS